MCVICCPRPGRRLPRVLCWQVVKEEHAVERAIEALKEAGVEDNELVSTLQKARRPVQTAHRPATRCNHPQTERPAHTRCGDAHVHASWVADTVLLSQRRPVLRALMASV